MSNEQIKALEESIKHWERLATGTSKRGEEPCSSYCECCKVFFDCSRNGNWCGGCPIDEYGYSGCTNDQYQDAAVTYDTLSRPKLSPTFRAAAGLEVKFLQEVLEWVKAGKPERE